MCGFSVYTGGDKMLRLSVVSEFQKIKYRGPDNTIMADFWMPNKEWDNCDVNDPRARVLPNYGKSGV